MAFGRKVGMLQLAAVSSAPVTLPTPTPAVVATEPASPPPVEPVTPPAQAVLDQDVPNVAIDGTDSAATLETAPPQVVPGAGASVVSEEEKEDSDCVPAVTSADCGIDEFDSPEFIDAMRSEQLFGAVDADDVNVSREALPCQEEVESISDPVDDPLPDYYESEVDSDSDFDDESHLFEQDNDAMRVLTASGWDLYDERHSCKSVLYRITLPVYVSFCRR
ncbi:hypothetical protein DVH05_008347 [Phytophthora capsici]|nr:hypothetical protein DVH05_008347 [Phytophthora capsici]